jgi:hypothetical protein
MLPVTEAVANIPWLPLGEAVARVARHLGYPTENAQLRIVRYVRARRITCGRTAEGWLVSLFPAAWREGADLDAANLELCLDELIAADLLPAPGGSEGPAERARQPADRAIAYLIKGYLVEWADWTPEMIREMERGEIKLGEAICDGLLAWGQESLQAPIEQIPRNQFRSEMVAMKALPVNPLRVPKVVVRVDGTVGVSPRHRLPDYTGRPWCMIEVDWAGLKAVTSSSAVVSPPKVSREVWLDQYLTEERQKDLATRHNGVTSATKEIHELMKNDPTVEAYAHARNIERHPTVWSLFPPSRPSKLKKKG